MSFYYTLQRVGKEEMRQRVNHKPMNYSRRATVDKHVERFIKAYAQYGDAGPVAIRIYENGEVIDTKTAQPNEELCQQ